LRRAITLVQKANHVKKNPTIEGMFKGNYPLFDRKSSNSEYVLFRHKRSRVLTISAPSRVYML
jgi:hypothetical protein